MAGKDSSHRQLKRQRLFEQGAAALRVSAPDLPPGYGCPLCAQHFSRIDLLTLEDVPPKKAGGKPLVLTCKKCNNNLGSLLDAHYVSGLRLERVARGELPFEVKATSFGHTVTAMATVTPTEISLDMLRERSNKGEHDALFREFEQSAKTNSLDWSMDLAWSSRHSYQRESLAWMKSAYLYAFAMLGYRFALRPGLNCVRQQFAHPDDDLVPGTHRRLSEGADDCLMFIHEPMSLRSIAVYLGRRAFFFPPMLGADDFFERFPSTRNDPGLRIKGLRMELQRTPQFLFDHFPSTALLTAPPDEMAAFLAARNA